MKVIGSNIPLWVIFSILYFPPWLFSGHVPYLQPNDIILCLLVFYTMASNHRYRNPIFNSKFIIVCMLYLILIGFFVTLSQGINSVSNPTEFSYKDLHYFITILKYLLLYFIIVTFSKRIKLLTFFYGILILVIAQIVIMFMQYYDVAGINQKFSPLYQQFMLFEDTMNRIEGRRVTGTFGNPNHSSFILSFGMVWLCSIYHFTDKLHLKLFTIITGLLSFIAVTFLTGSRSNGMIMFAIVPISAILYFFRVKNIVKIPFLITGMIIVIMTLSLSANYFESIGVQKRMVNAITDTGSTVDSLSKRLLVGERHFVDLTAVQYIIGVGAKTRINQICDNSYIQMVLYGGFLTLFIYILFLGKLLRFFLRHYFSEKEERKRFFSMAGLLSIISWIVYEWVADAFWNPQTSQLFILVIALCIGYLVPINKRYERIG